MGAQYLPLEGSEHFDLLQMKFYECKFHDMLRQLKSDWFFFFDINEIYFKDGGKLDMGPALI